MKGKNTGNKATFLSFTHLYVILSKFTQWNTKANILNDTFMVLESFSPHYKLDFKKHLLSCSTEERQTVLLGELCL